ncbi:hypothetical protein GCM10007301_52390 [Azorhizobium oxalatiphilum]|uniref:Uncharacterized protein n=1 Tax=Azorhizobium oxalatiphilum TaxID=980631 RepID=A0A917FHX2_9HYPH|nr:hypothetical protein [Azorhizobium oxalatiphilum]GGF86034.1 hypothetical protein GCM10007301_52390 [Azorhizobium oxalatiphilum]
MNKLHTVFAVLSITTTLAAGSVLAGPDVGPENAEQYAVSRQETLRPLGNHTNRLNMPIVRPMISGPSYDAHSGPSFDPSVN